MPWEPPQHLRVEKVDDVTVVHFEVAQINSEDSIRRIVDRLDGIIEGAEGIKLLLDFSGMTFASSSMLARLVHLKKKCVAAHGQMRLCCLAPYMRTVFEVIHLDRLLEIHGDEQAALDAFEGIHPSEASPLRDGGTETVPGE